MCCSLPLLASIRFLPPSQQVVSFFCCETAAFGCLAPVDPFFARLDVSVAVTLRRGRLVVNHGSAYIATHYAMVLQQRCIYVAFHFGDSF